MPGSSDASRSAPGFPLQTDGNDLGPKNPFLQPHYLLLNLAIGGDAAGSPEGTKFPVRYEIDYVRVYQKK